MSKRRIETREMILIMSSKDMYWRIVGVLCGMLLLTGCDRTRIVDDVKIIQSIGLDMENQQILGVASYPVYVSEMQESHPKKIFTASAKTTTSILDAFTKQTAHTIDLSQLSITVISEEFARNGIQDLLKVLNSDPNIATNSILAISKRDTKELFEESMKYPPYFLSSILEQSIHSGNIPINNLHTVTKQYYNNGQDMYMPVVNIDNEGLLISDGMGIFKDNKLNLLLDNKESILLKMLVDSNRFNCMYEVAGSDNQLIQIAIVSLNRKVISNSSDEKPEMRIDLNLKAILKETIPSAEIKGIGKSIRQEIEKDIEKKTVNILNEFQEKKVDPAGIGEIYRASDRKWDKDKFYQEIYPKLKFNVKVCVNIINTGARE